MASLASRNKPGKGNCISQEKREIKKCLSI